MATLTSPHGRPYPDGNERVRDGDNAMGALATAGDGHDVKMGSAASTAKVNVTATAPVDITGATVAVTTTRPNALVFVTAVFDMSTDVTGNTFLGSLVVDGAAQVAKATLRLATLNLRLTVAQSWVLTLAAAGPHTLKLQGALDAAAGTAGVNFPSTTISYILQEQ